MFINNIFFSTNFIFIFQYFTVHIFANTNVQFVTLFQTKAIIMFSYYINMFIFRKTLCMVDMCSSHKEIPSPTVVEITMPILKAARNM